MAKQINSAQRRHRRLQDGRGGDGDDARANGNGATAAERAALVPVRAFYLAPRRRRRRPSGRHFGMAPAQWTLESISASGRPVDSSARRRVGALARP